MPPGNDSGRVLIVGAGPAGAALALVLASRGIETTLVERQSDFAREFRGEVVTPGGMRALGQIGLTDGDLDKVPHQRPRSFSLYRGGQLVFEFSADPDQQAVPVSMSQPGLLELLVERAGDHANFRFLRGASVKDLLREGDRIQGVRLRTRDEELELRADLVIGADGRGSVVRKQGGFRVRDLGTPMDIVWGKLPWPASWATGQLRGYIGGGHLLIAIPSPEGLLQLAWVILKGTFGELKSRGVEEWLRRMADHVSPELASHLLAHAGEVTRPFLLNSVTDRVLGWAHPGCLLIGDAAHTMSPVGAQGINVGLRDAVVAANHLVPALLGQADARALDEAASRVESERGREIDRIQTLASFPPRVVLRPGRFAELLRAVLPRLALLARPIAARQVGLFLDGVTDVELRV